MFCPNCGSQIADSAVFCPSCGTSIQQKEEQPTTPETPTFDSVQAPVTKKKDNSTLILVFGIISLALAALCSLFFMIILFSGFDSEMLTLSVLGLDGAIAALVFGKIAKTMAANRLRADGMLSNNARTGAIMAKIGFIFGIVLTVLFAIALIIVVTVAVFDATNDILNDYDYYY